MMPKNLPSGEMANSRMVTPCSREVMSGWTIGTSLPGAEAASGGTSTATREPDFFFDRTLYKDTGFIGGPARHAESDAQARHARRRFQIADFEDFFVDKIEDLFSGGRNAQAAFVAVQRGDFGVLL